MQIKHVSFPRGIPEREEREWGGFGSVDGFSVDFHPFSYPLEIVPANLRDRSVFVRSYVEQQVATLAHGLAQLQYEFPGGLPIVIIGTVRPVPVHRHAGFPYLPRITGGRNELLRCNHVTGNPSAHPVVQDYVGMLPDHVVEAHCLSVCDVASLVEPNDRGLGKLREQLADLGK